MARHGDEEIGFGAPPGGPPFAELCALSNFTFLTGASHPEEYVARAAELGLAAIAVADRNSLAGVVRAHVAARDLRRRAPGWDGRFLVGCRLALEDSPVAWAALPVDRAGYGRLCRLLTIGKQRAGKGECRLVRADLEEWGEGLFLLALVDDPLEGEEGSASANGAWLSAAPYPLPSPPPRGGRESRRGGWRETPPFPPAHPSESGAALATRAPPPLVGGGREGGMAPAYEPSASPTAAHITALAACFPGRAHLAARPAYDGRDKARLAAYARLAAATGAPMIATADPLMHNGARRRLADVLTCIRERTTVDRLGARALPNAERRLRSGAEMARLFHAWPEALARTVEIAAAIRFSLDDLRYEYPDEIAIDPETGERMQPQERLAKLAWEGLRRRYPDGVPERASSQCAHELALIGRLDYARYFLTVRDIVAFAESQGILVQGRGSAANSVVCYALGVTAIGPEIGAMVFERFVSEARNEPPDIDVDFEHERREEVIQHIYKRYGRERAGLCATVIHFRARAAIRELGRAMGLSQDALSAISSQVWGISDKAVDEARLREIGLDPSDRRLRQTLELIREIIGFPRHLSQHVGGFVITAGRLDELCPIENAAMEDRTVIEWDKDDIDALGILKVDVLSLGMLTCIRKALDLIAQHVGPRYTLASIPPEEPDVYDMLSEGDSIGVFQVESRAQISFLPRMKPRKFYDLVIEVAIVRPGPIQGDMVHPYLRRRQGKEEVTFPSQELADVLGRTLGVPLFQEQAMQIAIVAAGFSAEEADGLRRALATFRKSGTIHNFRERFIGGMIARGYQPEFAERCFSQIEGFGEYGFPESHAASFALLVYASAWIKRRHPAIFACALLNSQPMGFYAPAQIVRDARNHGVTVRPVCVNASYWDNTLEPDGRGGEGGGLALRLGFRQIKGFNRDDAAWITAARGNGYPAVEDVWRRAGVQPAALKRLAEADAFHGLGLTRRDALWAAEGIEGAEPPPLFADLLEGEGRREPEISLPAMTDGEAVVEDYRSTRLSLRAHPLALLRAELTPPTDATTPPRPPSCRLAAQLAEAPPKARVSVAGLVITRQRPGSAKGVIFLTLEDESGVANVVVWRAVNERFRRAVISGRLLRVTGRIQREGEGKYAVAHLAAEKIEDLSPLLDRLAEPDGGPSGAAPSGPRASARHPREQAKRLFPSRDFH